MKLRVRKIVPNAVLPYKAHESDAGFDLVANSIEVLDREGIIVYGTGLAVQIPKGYVGLIVPRSSIHKTKNVIVNSPGIIDAGYTGELKILCDTRFTPSDKVKTYKIGDRVAQLVILKLPSFEIVEAQRFNETARNSNGFGSTGE